MAADAPRNANAGSPASAPPRHIASGLRPHDGPTPPCGRSSRRRRSRRSGPFGLDRTWPGYWSRRSAGPRSWAEAAHQLPSGVISIVVLAAAASLDVQGSQGTRTARRRSSWRRIWRPWRSWPDRHAGQTAEQAGNWQTMAAVVLLGGTFFPVSQARHLIQAHDRSPDCFCATARVHQHSCLRCWSTRSVGRHSGPLTG